MAEYTVVSGDRVIKGSKPLAIVSPQEANEYLDDNDIVRAYAVELPGGMLALYLKSSIEQGASPSEESPAQVTAPLRIKPVEQSKGKWVKCTPAHILPGKKLRCISGSNSGKKARIKSVVRPGKPDAQTDYLQPRIDGVSPSLQAGQMVMYSTGLGRPDNVSIEWIDQPEGVTHETNAEGQKVGKQISAPIAMANLTKARLCNEFLVWVED